MFILVTFPFLFLRSSVKGNVVTKQVNILFSNSILYTLDKPIVFIAVFDQVITMLLNRKFFFVTKF